MKTNIGEFFKKIIELCKKTNLYPIITIFPFEQDQGMCHEHDSGRTEIGITWGALKNREIQYNLATMAHELGHMNLSYQTGSLLTDPDTRLIQIYEVLLGCFLYVLIFAALLEVTFIQLSLVFPSVIFSALTISLLAFISKLYYLKHLRKNEYKADSFVVDCDFGEVYLTSDLGPDNFREIFSTHPSSHKRKENISELIKGKTNEG